MDWLAILEQYGLPLVVAVAFWLFIQKQNKFIQDELQKELRESFTRVESIIVKLIDQQKKNAIRTKRNRKLLQNFSRSDSIVIRKWIKGQIYENAGTK